MSRHWDQANPERKRELQRQWYRANRERLLAKRKKPAQFIQCCDCRQSIHRNSNSQKRCMACARAKRNGRRRNGRWGFGRRPNPNEVRNCHKCGAKFERPVNCTRKIRCQLCQKERVRECQTVWRLGHLEKARAEKKKLRGWQRANLADIYVKEVITNGLRRMGISTRQVSLPPRLVRLKRREILLTRLWQTSKRPLTLATNTTTSRS